MNKIGVLYCGYNTEEYINSSLIPWIQARELKPANCEFLISAVSVPFLEYKDLKVKKDNTQRDLESYKYNNNIDHLFISNDYYTEKDARNKALEPLLSAGCEAIWLVDSDEAYSIYDIEKILNYVNLEKFISWFSVSYKNYVFNVNTYLKDPFTPPRIFRVNTNGYKLGGFYWDNDIAYFNGFTPNLSYKELPSKTIPSKIAFVPHFTWLSTEKNKLKCEYQQKHFGHCGYKWNEVENKLEFNEEYYKKIGQQIPEIIKE